MKHLYMMKFSAISIFNKVKMKQIKFLEQEEVEYLDGTGRAQEILAEEVANPTRETTMKNLVEYLKKESII